MPVGVFLECGIDNAYFALMIFHKAFYKFGCTVAHNHVFLLDSEILSRKEGIDTHSGGIFAKEGLKVGFHLVNHSSSGEVGVDKIAEIKQFGITPIAAIALLDLFQLLLRGGEYCLSNTEILHIVDLIPEAIDRKCLDSTFVYQRDNAKHLLVILVFTEHLDIGIKEREIVIDNEITAELVDIDSLVVEIGVAILEGGFRYEIHYVAVIINPYHRTVHPRFIF